MELLLLLLHAQFLQGKKCLLLFLARSWPNGASAAQGKKVLSPSLTLNREVGRCSWPNGAEAGPMELLLLFHPQVVS